jgi:Ca2+-binding EF-hand superfamily protein
LLLDEVKEAFKGSGLSEKDIHEVFERVDIGNDGYIRYGEFVAACMNKEKVV